MKFADAIVDQFGHRLPGNKITTNNTKDHEPVIDINSCRLVLFVVIKIFCDHAPVIQDYTSRFVLFVVRKSSCCLAISMSIQLAVRARQEDSIPSGNLPVASLSACRYQLAVRRGKRIQSHLEIFLLPRPTSLTTNRYSIRWNFSPGVPHTGQAPSSEPRGYSRRRGTRNTPPEEHRFRPLPPAAPCDTALRVLFRLPRPAERVQRLLHPLGLCVFHELRVHADYLVVLAADRRLQVIGGGVDPPIARRWLYA